MIGRVEACDIVKLFLFVDVDEDTIVEGLPQAGSFHLARLEHGIAVGEDDGGPPLPHVRHHVQCPRIEAIGEGIIDQPTRHSQHLRSMQILRPVTLQRAEVIGVAELAPQLFENLPIAIAGGGAVGLFEVFAQMRLHPIVVDERVVDVEQEDDVGRLAHQAPIPTGLQRPLNKCPRTRNNLGLPPLWFSGCCFPEMEVDCWRFRVDI